MIEITDSDWPVPLSFAVNQGKRLAYRHFKGKSAITLVCLGGFHSNMNGEKAFRVFNHARELNHSALCFDYSGHGASEGDFAEGTISSWLDDAGFMVQTFCPGPVVIVGSSMGAWITLLLAMRLKNKVQGILTIACATDFTEKFVWARCSAVQRSDLAQKGYFTWQSPYDEEPFIFTMKLIEDGRRHLLLSKTIPVTCPVRLIHGTADTDIDWQNSQKTMQKLASDNVELLLVKDAGHRLSEPANIARIIHLVDELLALIVKS